MRGLTFMRVGQPAAKPILRLRRPPPGIPANVLTLGGQPLTLNGEYLTYSGGA